MGILRSQDSQESAVTHNIEKARRTVYSLMSAGFHGDNGLDPDTSIHLLQTYVLPVLVYGLEVLLPRKVLIERLNRIHKKFLKMILSLPETVADPAVYVLSGTAPIECVIHKRALTLYGNICRLSEDTVEKQLARRQLSVKGYRGSSWFVEIRKLLLKYGLPPAWELLDDPLQNSGGSGCYQDMSTLTGRSRSRAMQCFIPVLDTSTSTTTFRGRSTHAYKQYLGREMFHESVLKLSCSRVHTFCK